MQDVNSKLREFAFSAERTNTSGWVIDSGCTTHISKDKELFKEIYNVNGSEIVIANGQKLMSYGKGDIELRAKTNGNQENIITLKNVLYVPDIHTNLLSVHKATQNNAQVIFNKNGCKLIHDGKTYIQGTLRENLYEAEFENSVPRERINIAQECDNENCVTSWHRKLGHRSIKSINELVSKNLAIGIKLNKCKHDTQCEVCVKSKLTKKPYPKKAEHRSNRVLNLILSDVVGPMNTQTLGGKKYLLTFTDDHSRFSTIYFLSHKDEVYEKLKEYISMVRNKFGKTPLALRSDNGGEYVGKNVENYLKSLGIRHQLTIPHSAPQNGISERKGRSLVEMARCLLNQGNLPYSLWGEAVNTANFLTNRLPTKAHEKTPFELWENYRPNLANLKPFGCKAFAYVEKINRTKFDDRAEEGIFVGYTDNPKGYRILMEDNKIKLSRTVKFFEKDFPKQNPHLAYQKLNIPEAEQVEIECQAENEDERGCENERAVERPEHEAPRRSARENRGVPPDRFAYLADNKIGEPKSWDDIINMKNPADKTKWMEAARDEINSLNENKTWTLVDAPLGKTVIGSKWTFKIKRDDLGNIGKFKARLVAKGFSQKFGDSYDETFAPVVSHTTIRTLLATAAHKNLKIKHIDVKTAFLNGDLKEDIYMCQPEGFEIPGQETAKIPLRT